MPHPKNSSKNVKKNRTKNATKATQKIMIRSFHSKARPARINDLSEFAFSAYAFNLLVYFGFWRARQLKPYAGELQNKDKEHK